MSSIIAPTLKSQRGLARHSSGAEGALTALRTLSVVLKRWGAVMVHPQAGADDGPQAGGEGGDALDFQVVPDDVEVVVEAHRQLHRERQARLAGRDRDQQVEVVAAVFLDGNS